MNGFAALCAFIATFSPPLGQMPVTPQRTPTNIGEHLQQQDARLDARLDGPRIQGVIYFDAPTSSSSQRILR